jgi:hypothetical protein
LLSHESSMSWAHLAAGAFYVVLTLTNVGGVLEGRRWAYATEQARLVALGGALVFMLVNPSSIGGVTLGMERIAMASLAITIASLLVLRSQRGQFATPSDERMDVGHRHQGPRSGEQRH